MGTIIPRLTDRFTSTSEASKYLYCDGSIYDTAKYPKLYTILGTNQIPDLRGKFLQGNDIGGTFIEAGLPNITGTFFTDDAEYVRFFTGAFYYIREDKNNGINNGGNSNGGLGGFNASRSSSVYGKSNTVQPPAVTVRYYIRAK